MPNTESQIKYISMMICLLDGCAKDNGGCEMFCYTSADVSEAAAAYQCGCQYGYKLNADSTTCRIG